MDGLSFEESTLHWLISGDFLFDCFIMSFLWFLKTPLYSSSENKSQLIKACLMSSIVSRLLVVFGEV